jgi:hypothetical protein
MLVGVGEERHDFLFLARIERAGHDPAAGTFDVRDQRCELVAVATSREDRESLGSEASSNGCTDIIARADNGGSSISLWHVGSWKAEG